MPNPLTKYAGANYTLSDGNLKAVKSGGNVVSLNGTIGVSYGDGGNFTMETIIPVRRRDKHLDGEMINILLTHTELDLLRDYFTKTLLLHFQNTM